MSFVNCYSRIEKKIYLDRNILLEKIKERELRNLVFTNGCFDILHKGHVSCLSRAKDLGEILIVGLNSDDSVKKLKGDNRPVNTWHDRAFVLAGLESVDYIVFFNESTPMETLELLKPDIHAKGGDYKPEDMPEKKIIDSYGGRIEILSFVEGHSTTNIIEKQK